MLRPLLVPFALSACATAHGLPAGDYRFNGLEADGEIRVMPLVSAHRAPPLRTDDFVTEEVSAPRRAIRQQRTAQVQEVPRAIGEALPGAIHAKLDPSWQGRFTVAKSSRRASERLRAAIRRNDPERLEARMIEIARSTGGGATLFSWVSQLDAVPVSTLDLPGTLLEGPSGTLLVDLFEEPYLIDAEIGLALVSADGHVILRYSDTIAGLLSPDRTPARAGWSLAGRFSHEIQKVWPDDPHLYRLPEENPAERARAGIAEVSERWAPAPPREILYSLDGSRRPPSATQGSSPEDP
ncbi:MAG: hypothetical protein EA397_18480 [Deltaproteobacteria bacterium]|nr:MAG: hypothetical protein EA397_18480 [Deltaproteobacteria bacterium]